MYYTSNYYDEDFDDYYILNDCEFSNEDYCEYDYYYVDDDYYYDYDDDDYDYYCYDDDYLCYKRSLNYFKRLVSHKNNGVNWIDNVHYNHEITLLVNNHIVCIC